ncbi:hypothetical protein GCK32_001792 [Trichostrongylus colubriformis]|uniref:Uncharacterized protein n=1 Tax=Trichostrongylus colubriformis TaxID=6319 RepID=A0AAN8IZV7_TRICO
MGNNYTSLSTHDPNDLLVGRDRQFIKKSATFSSLPVTRPPIHTDSITAMAVVRPGMVITGSRDKTLALNNVDTGECVTRWTVCVWDEAFPTDADLLQCVSFNDGHVVVSGGKGLLAHIRVQGRAGKPYFQMLSIQKPIS